VQRDLEGGMFSNGVATEGRPGNAMIQQLVSNGQARELATE
jgi:hypothetical protein